MAAIEPVTQLIPKKASISPARFAEMTMHPETEDTSKHITWGELDMDKAGF
ncbi:MAG: hypothetical protein HGJ93_09540 [Desulfosarcina sp.]|nr:hypothetical protein [Desulfosarcina sp.]MBC2766182.1 hypothetical protein [Desulfosarcina sp.]